MIERYYPDEPLSIRRLNLYGCVKSPMIPQDSKALLLEFLVIELFWNLLGTCLGA